jgi:hypothetical protein
MKILVGCGSIGAAIAAYFSNAQTVEIVYSDRLSQGNDRELKTPSYSYEFNNPYQCYDDDFLLNDEYCSNLMDWDVYHNFKINYRINVELGYAKLNCRCPRDCLICGIRGEDLILERSE